MAPLPFSGPAKPLPADGFEEAAAVLHCDVATVKAVTIVETGGAGGFLSDGSGRPRILFEAAVFHDFTAGKFDASHPTLSVRTPNSSLYEGGAAEYDRLSAACVLDRDAALRSTSWGLFQIMGENFDECGMKDVEAFVKAMAYSETAQVLAFACFCLHRGLGPSLVAHNWAIFADRYNGPDYLKNDYTGRLARAFAIASGDVPAVPTSPLYLQIGSSGPMVVRLQAALHGRGYALDEDGIFGRVTELVLQKFQAGNGLIPDGIVGGATAAALSLT